MVFVAPATGTVFQIQGTNVWNNNQIGNLNVVADGAGGSLKTGNSSKTLTNSSTDTAAGAVQIVDVLRDGSNETSATPSILVRFNPAAIAAVQLG